VKNVLDYVEDLRADIRLYLDGRAVGCVAMALGWQATVTTLTALRSIVHALRGWPTPLGAALNSVEVTFDGSGAPPTPPSSAPCTRSVNRSWSSPKRTPPGSCHECWRCRGVRELDASHLIRPTALAIRALIAALVVSPVRAVPCGHDNGVLGITWSPDGQGLATGSSDRTARVWDAGSGLTLAVLRSW
jgi:hypothetical protein